LGFKSQFKRLGFPLKNLIKKNLKSGFEVAYGIEEG